MGLALRPCGGLTYGGVAPWRKAAQGLCVELKRDS